MNERPGEKLRIEIDGGKYTLVINDDESISIDETGDPWQPGHGRELLKAMAYELDELRTTVAKLLVERSIKS